jgi:hypothetical protein
MRPHEVRSIKARVITIGLLACGMLSLSPYAQAENASAHSQAKQKTAPYYQDAQLCRAKSVIDPLPEGADPATSIDPAKFIQCINQHGYQQEAKTDPFLVAVHRCRHHKTRAVSASGEEQMHAPSQAQVRACMVGRGFPSTGTPPHPNAPVDAIKQVPPHTQNMPPAPTSQPAGTDEGVQTVVIPPRKH